MWDILLNTITYVHLLLVGFIVAVPFTNSNYFLLLHAILVPFIIFHWILNDNTCVLTIIEKKIRKDYMNKTDDEDCITCKLIEPVYDFKKNYSQFTTIIYVITIILWLISVSRLVYKYRSGQIESFSDLIAL